MSQTFFFGMRKKGTTKSIQFTASIKNAKMVKKEQKTNVDQFGQTQII